MNTLNRFRVAGGLMLLAVLACQPLFPQFKKLPDGSKWNPTPCSVKQGQRGT